ncbi:MAG: 50S ribosomal protein L6 [Mycoplasmataceae bacterium]|jgi:large subunit ribosomal protein L6|nr:50S ribosomal protein L6 [Mycoplasmataceae bacterium]
MSRKGNKLISIPDKVSLNVQKDFVDVKGPLGTLKVDYPSSLITVAQENGKVKVTRANDDKQTRMYHGTVGSNLANAVDGVSRGFSKILKIVGVGYKAAIKGNTIDLAMGYSHPVVFEIPAGLKVNCPTPTQIDIFGYDKQAVGQFAAVVRDVRPPEPYKGKGIAYSDEFIIRKVGKTAEGSKKK